MVKKPDYSNFAREKFLCSFWALMHRSENKELPSIGRRSRACDHRMSSSNQPPPNSHVQFCMSFTICPLAMKVDQATHEKLISRQIERNSCVFQHLIFHFSSIVDNVSSRMSSTLLLKKVSCSSMRPKRSGTAC